MSRTVLAAALMASALTALPAMAQDQSGKFVTQQPQNEWRASKLIGIDVYGQDNQKIGDVREILIDRSGNAKTVVIGVGGFLGIGEKDVGVPFNSLQWSDQPASGSARTAATRSNTDAAGTGTSSATTTAGGVTAPSSTAANTDRTASTSSSSSSSNSSADRGYPDHAMVQMSKNDLQNAPTFKYAGHSGSSNR